MISVTFFVLYSNDKSSSSNNSGGNNSTGSGSRTAGNESESAAVSSIYTVYPSVYELFNADEIE